MLIKTYLDKSNTIVYDSHINQGFSPITYIFYGDEKYSRYLFHFNLDYIRQFICDGTFADTCKLKHTLKMFNSGALDFRQMTQPCGFSSPGKQMQRAISFDLILFQIPVDWDQGRGHDHPKDGYIIGDSYISNQGSNWFNSHTCIQWGYNRLGEYEHTSDEPYGGIVNGIYDNKFLQQEYTKYLSGQNSIILTTVHFDLGSENIEIDLTNIINNMIIKPDIFPNNGFCLAFDPFLETRNMNPAQTINFFTNNTSTWFEPYLQTEYQIQINDDRANFYLDKWNKLYLYSNVGGEPTNLNKIPICTITGNYEDGTKYTLIPEVKQATKGIYYVDILLCSGNAGGIENNRMFFDEWSNLEYFNCSTQSGIRLKPVELDFTTKSADNFYLIGNNDFLPKQYTPTVSGIKYNERIERENGEIRKCIVRCDIPYTQNQSEIIDILEYKIYIRDGNKEIDWCNWQPVHKAFNHNFFLLDIDSFLPNEYNIRLKTSSNLEVRMHDSLKFQIISKEKEGHYS